ncbi:MAG: glucosaminidase domain-containing protein [Bacteroidota bacterium]
MHIRHKIVKFLFSCAFIMVPVYIFIQPVAARKSTEAEVVPLLTLENVYFELVKQEIKHPEIVMRQVIAETNWLKCKKCSRQFNNLFGFLTKSGYLKFDNWKESVAYYKKWQDEFYKDGDYYLFLRRVGYATSPNYERLLKQIIVPDFI